MQRSISDTSFHSRRCLSPVVDEINVRKPVHVVRLVCRPDEQAGLHRSTIFRIQRNTKCQISTTLHLH